MSQISEDEESLFELMAELRVSVINPSSDESVNETLRLRQSYKESVSALTETLWKKYKEGELIIKKMTEFQNEIQLLNKRIEEKQGTVLETISKVKQGEKQRVTLKREIEDLKEELTKKREYVSVAKRANKDRLKELHKCSTFFKDRLGLEIRKVYGDRLQFVFRCIDPKDPDEPYTFMLYINEQGDYEITDCDPPLECMPEFQRRVRETNNFSALLTNFRKAFTTLAHH